MANNPNHIENIEPHKFKKGRSGNPKGRPKGNVSLVPMLKAKLEEAPAGQRRSFAEAFIESTLLDAIKNDGQSRKLVWEYLEGRPTQRLEHSGPDGGAITIAELVRRAGQS